MSAVQTPDPAVGLGQIQAADSAFNLELFKRQAVETFLAVKQAVEERDLSGVVDLLSDRIYDDLRTEFDLADRYAALELKLRSVQEALELVVDVARDRRLLLLEVAVAILILVEILLPLFHVYSLAALP